MKLADIARAVAAHNPDTRKFGHVLVGLSKPLKGSPSGLTWRDIQKLAKVILLESEPKQKRKTRR